MHRTFSQSAHTKYRLSQPSSNQIRNRAIPFYIHFFLKKRSTYLVVICLHRRSIPLLFLIVFFVEFFYILFRPFRRSLRLEENQHALYRDVWTLDEGVLICDHTSCEGTDISSTWALHSLFSFPLSSSSSSLLPTYTSFSESAFLFAESFFKDLLDLAAWFHSNYSSLG